jgi:AhpD family alkylhydroperoxidase
LRWKTLRTHDVPLRAATPTTLAAYGMGVAVVRLLTVDQAPLLARGYYAAGDPGPITTSLAQVPEVLEVALPFFGTVLGPSTLSLRTKELVIVRVSALMQCRYCTQTHSAVALEAGLSREEILALCGQAPIEAAFADPAERALLGYADAVATGPGPVDPAIHDALCPHFADHEIVELTILAGTTVLLNRYATALQLPTGAETLRRLAEEDLL